MKYNQIGERSEWPWKSIQEYGQFVPITSLIKQYKKDDIPYIQENTLQ